MSERNRCKHENLKFLRHIITDVVYECKDCGATIYSEV